MHIGLMQMKDFFEPHPQQPVMPSPTSASGSNSARWLPGAKTYVGPERHDIQKPEMERPFMQSTDPTEGPPDSLSGAGLGLGLLGLLAVGFYAASK